MKTVGISIHLNTEDYSIWNNGVRQLIFFFAEALQRIGSYNVLIVNTNPAIAITSKLSWDQKRFPTVNFHEVRDQLELLFIVGSEISPADGHFLKSKGCRVVYFNCGNRYIIEMEEMLFKGGKGKRPDLSYLDEVWILPQMINSCYYYIETVYRIPVRPVPFPWSPLFIDASTKGLPNNARYQALPGPKRLSCFEPNLNVVKFCMYDLLIAERAYRVNPKLISAFYVTNAIKLKESEMFVTIANTFDIVRAKVATFEARFPMPLFLAKYTDIVVAHQWENALNYAYLDALYLGYPLVHNAHIIKDAGYYYEGFNAQEGAEQLLYALEHHDSRRDEYAQRSAAVLERYSNSNPENLRVYDQLIRDLLAKPRS